MSVYAHDLRNPHCVLKHPGKWVTTRAFEAALLSRGDALGSSVTSVTIQIPADSKLMIDVVVRLLSFCNQFSLCTKRVKLEFADEGAMDYLNRMGFFDQLDSRVIVLPRRPSFSGASIYRGGNLSLVEIEHFNQQSGVDKYLEPRLADTVKRVCANRPDVEQIHAAIFCLFGELISNVFDHSGSALDAYAALQSYPQGNRITVTVSDDAPLKLISNRQRL